MYNSKYLLLSWVNSDLLREVHCGAQAVHLALELSKTTQFAEWSDENSDNRMSIFGTPSQSNLSIIQYVLHALKKYDVLEDVAVASFRGTGQRYDTGHIISTGILMPSAYLDSTSSSFYPVTLGDLFNALNALENKLISNQIANDFRNGTLDTTIARKDIIELRIAFISWLKNEKRVY